MCVCNNINLKGLNAYELNEYSIIKQIEYVNDPIQFVYFQNIKTYVFLLE